MSERRVQQATIAYANGLFDLAFFGGSARAALTMDDGTTDEFVWFDDELTYTSADFMGKTMAEIRQMHLERDMAYLRS